MSTTVVKTPTSRLRLGMARAEITPPVGIYHRVWGAARHDRASGVHRPLYGDVLALGPVDGDSPALLRVNLDLVGLVLSQHKSLQNTLGGAVGLPPESVVVAYAHSHAAGWFVPDRVPLPGGELIEQYLDDLVGRLTVAAREAAAVMQPAAISYAVGHCGMAANRDYWDDALPGHVCGYNPDTPADDTVVAARLTDASGSLLATLVNYACHPTTLAWENSLLSPDFVGAARETVERSTGRTCIYAQGACGDLAPRDDYVGGPDVADRNGRQVGYAALSALESLGPPDADYAYDGPVVSGATLGVWRHVPLSPGRAAETSRFAGGAFTVELPLRSRPDPTALRAELASWERLQREADARGDALAARDHGAQAERARRWLARLTDFPSGDTYALGFTVHRLGDAIWVTTGGEPYSYLQVELRRRFPAATILVSPLAGDMQVAYMLPSDRYGNGLYQEEPSILGPGCLEQLTEAIAGRIAELL